MAHDPRLFFQVAAALIPALVFGGFLTDRLRPPDDWDFQRRSWVSLLLMAAAFFVLIAEVTAIHAALTGRAAAWETAIVALAVVGATAALLAGLVWPWVGPLLRHPAGRLSAGQRAILLLGIVGIVLLSAFTLTSAVRLEQALQEFEALEALDEEESPVNALLAAYGNAIQARADAGLYSEAEARRVRACIADRVFKQEVAQLFTHVTEEEFPLDAFKGLDPVLSRPLRCEGLEAIDP